MKKALFLFTLLGSITLHAGVNFVEYNGPGLTKFSGSYDPALLDDLKERFFTYSASRGRPITDRDSFTFYYGGWKSDRLPLDVKSGNYAYLAFTASKPGKMIANNKGDRLIEIQYYSSDTDRLSDRLLASQLEEMFNSMVEAIARGAIATETETDNNSSSLSIGPSANNTISAHNTKFVSTNAISAGVNFVEYTGPGLTKFSGLYDPALPEDLKERFFTYSASRGRPITDRDSFTFYYGGWKSNRLPLDVKSGNYAYIAFTATKPGNMRVNDKGDRLIEIQYSSSTDRLSDRFLTSQLEEMFNSMVEATHR